MIKCRLQPNQCPLCLSIDRSSPIWSSVSPVHQHVFYDSIEKATSSLSGKLDMRECTKCGFVYNECFDGSLLEYDPSYNSRVVSSAYSSYMDSLIGYLIDECWVAGKTVIDVGSGSGLFIESLVVRGNNIGYAVDPRYSERYVQWSGKLTFIPEYLKPGLDIPKADVIICRHLIEHIEDPVGFMMLLRQYLKDETSRIFIETPDVKWILNNSVFYDFFYEHCSLFSSRSLSYLADVCGIDIYDQKHLFGGQFLLAEFREPPSSGKMEASLDRCSNFIEGVSKTSKVVVVGASGKSVSFINKVDPFRKYISFVIEDNKEKHGKFIPTTGHEVRPFDAIYDGGKYTVLVLNPIYYMEVCRKTISYNNVRVVAL